MEDTPIVPPAATTVARLKGELTQPPPSGRRRAAEKFLLAAIGSIPWIGGFLAAAASVKDDLAGERRDELQTKWLEEHQTKISEFGETLGGMEERFSRLGPEVEERIQSPEYLTLVRGAFRAWDEAETDEKRKCAANLIVNAAGSRICSDDVVRLFIDWIEMYHEVHFAVMREIFQHPGSSRLDIWVGIYGNNIPREDSAEADLFKLMIRDLSTGSVIRQERDVNVTGQFVKRRPQIGRGSASSTMESAFEETKPYVLTDLGKQFVHYTMSDVVVRVSPGATKEDSGD